MRLEGRQSFEEVTEHRLADLFFGKAGSKMTAPCCCKRILEKSKEFPTDDPDSFMNYETMMARLLSFHEPDLVPLYPKFVRICWSGARSFRRKGACSSAVGFFVTSTTTSPVIIPTQFLYIRAVAALCSDR